MRGTSPNQELPRLRILGVLDGGRRLTVRAIAAALELKENSVHQSLTKMARKRVVRVAGTERDGPTKFRYLWVRCDG